LTDSGASLRLEPGDWSEALLDGVARLHLSGYPLFSDSGRAFVAAALKSARARGVPVSLDPASAGFLAGLGSDRFLALVEGVDVLLPSRDEACLLTGLSDPAEAAAALSRDIALVVVTCGARGALLARAGEVRARVPAVTARARDTTGAGDAFTGALRAALLAGGHGGRGPRARRRAAGRPVDPLGTGGRLSPPPAPGGLSVFGAVQGPFLGGVPGRPPLRLSPAARRVPACPGVRVSGRCCVACGNPSGLASPRRHQGCGGQVQGARGDVREVAVDVLGGGDAGPDEPVAHQAHGGGLQGGALGCGQGEVRVGPHAAQARLPQQP